MKRWMTTLVAAGALTVGLAVPASAATTSSDQSVEIQCRSRCGGGDHDGGDDHGGGHNGGRDGDDITQVNRQRGLVNVGVNANNVLNDLIDISRSVIVAL